VDGHDVDVLVDTLKNVRKMNGPILVHVITRKGKGYDPAEKDPYKWHGAKPFDKVTGRGTKSGGGLPRYQAAFGKGLTELGARDPRVVAITAAMPDGTSTQVFDEAFPDRFFDVGIAESHGVCSAAGMACEGLSPVVAIYSTFLQRGYDNIVHDVALQELPVVFAMDRAGIAGEDGPTHHGGLDISYMLGIPHMTVTAPKDGSEMIALLRLGIEHQDGPFSLRYPRDSVPAPVPSVDEIPAVEYGRWEMLRKGDGSVAVLAVGTMVLPALEAARRLASEGIDATVVNCRFLKPYDRKLFEAVLTGHRAILTLEEGTRVNGFGAYMVHEAQAIVPGSVPRFEVHGLPDDFVEHGARAGLLADLGLDVEGITERIRALAEACAPKLVDSDATGPGDRVSSAMESAS
jgi:1-deoxy-D-xylulose-5-phosphate synthase